MKNQTFQPKVYQGIPYDDLLVFSLFSVLQKKLEPSFENLVVECFELFPERFGLPGYTNKYPDSAQVDKSWLRCRTDKNLITGSKAQGFELTAQGLNIVEKTRRKLGNKVGNVSTGAVLSMKGDRRTKTGRLVKELEGNKSFQEYQKNGSEAGITEFDFCDLIYSTLDSLPENRRKNLEQLKSAVASYNRADMLDFLEFCERKFSSLLFSQPSDQKYEGGMMKQKKS